MYFFGDFFGDFLSADFWQNFHGIFIYSQSLFIRRLLKEVAFIKPTHYILKCTLPCHLISLSLRLSYDTGTETSTLLLLRLLQKLYQRTMPLKSVSQRDFVWIKIWSTYLEIPNGVAGYCILTALGISSSSFQISAINAWHKNCGYKLMGCYSIS